MRMNDATKARETKREREKKEEEKSIKENAFYSKHGRCECVSAFDSNIVNREGAPF